MIRLLLGGRCRVWGVSGEVFPALIWGFVLCFHALPAAGEPVPGVGAASALSPVDLRTPFPCAAEDGVEGRDERRREGIRSRPPARPRCWLLGSHLSRVYFPPSPFPTGEEIHRVLTGCLSRSRDLTKPMSLPSPPLPFPLPSSTLFPLCSGTHFGGGLKRGGCCVPSTALRYLCSASTPHTLPRGPRDAQPGV